MVISQRHLNQTIAVLIYKSCIEESKIINKKVNTHLRNTEFERERERPMSDVREREIEKSCGRLVEEEWICDGV